MSLGSKIRGIVNTVGQKAKKISSLGHKAGKFVGTFDKSLGKDINEAADIADKVARVDKDVGDIGTTTGLFKKGGMTGHSQAMKMGGKAQVARALVGPVARTGLTHLATAGLGAGAKLLAQPHDQLRKRDIITEGGKLSRQARSHLKSFRM
jgi:hypothetical protein